MSIPLFAPFTAERYAAVERLSTLIAPPYDVVTASQREQLAENPENIVHLTLPSGHPDPYAIAADTLAGWRSRGVLVRDANPSLTVLRQEFVTRNGKAHERTGVIGGVVVEAFATGRVKPHERTHSGPKEDRLALLKATQSMFEALLFFAKDAEGTVQRLLLEVTKGEPTARAVLGDDSLAIWSVGDARAAEIAEAASAGALYVGDGHHRYETAVEYLRENPNADRVPGLVVPLGDAGLVVLPTHRTLYGAPLDIDAVVHGLRRSFEVRELAGVARIEQELARLGERGTACGVIVPGPRAYAVLLKQGPHHERLTSAESTVAALDVARVDETVIPLLTGSPDGPRRVGYDADTAEVVSEVREGHAAAAVLLNATKIDQVLAVADAGAVMPQKSTYFTPKVPSGIVGMSYAA